MKIALVLWHDAHFAESDDGTDHIPIHSVGVLLRNTKKCVKLAQSYDSEGASEVLTIPRDYVKSVEIIGKLPIKRVKGDKE